MGLGGWIKDKASDAGDAVTDKIDDAGEYLEDAVEDGKETLGGLVNTGAHGLGDLLDEVGLEDASDFVDARGDDFADAMGADVAEMQLGDTEDAKQLIHGEAGKIDEVVTHLNSFASSMNSAATGLSGIDTGGWTGGAAEGYKSIASSQPGKWRTAGTAMSDAASAWSAYASTVTWAQGKAKEAITQYEKGKKASETAVDSYNTKVRTYNAGVEAGKTVEELPDKPGPFVDPGQADMEAAQQTLTDARSQRDEAADRARTSITSATSGAPQEPEFTDRVAAGVGDVYQMQQIWGAHATAGAFKATGEVVKFARGLNPTDPYNMRHPAAYVEGLSNTATGLIHTANHPTEVVSAIIGSGWTTDPAEAFGKLIPTIVGTAATGGAGGAASVTARLGSRTAVNAAERSALRVADDVATTHTGSMDDLIKATTKDPVDLATGTVLLAQTDVELPGLLPLVLQRKHLSSWRYGLWFGRTWASTLDERLDVGEDAVVLVRGDGVLLTYDPPTLETPTLPRAGARWPMVRTETDGYTVTDPDTGQQRHYFDARAGAVFLAAITDANGNRISIARNEVGAPVEVRHTGGYRILVESTDQRVASLRAAHGDVSEASDRWDGTGVPETPENELPGTEFLRFSYDSDGHLAEVSNPSGSSPERALRFSYDEHGRLTRWRDRNDAYYRYDYDGDGRCVSSSGTSDALATAIRYVDEADGSRTTYCTDSLGHTTTYLINAQSQVMRIINPLGASVEQEWDQLDRLLSRTDALGRVTRFEHDEDGRLVRVVRPDGSDQTWQYASSVGEPTRVVLPDGAQWRQQFDDRGNRTSVTDPAGSTTSYAYDERGRLTSVTLADGGVVRVQSDAAGLPVATTDPLGATTRHVRDELGRVVEVTDALGATTTLEWTPEGWLAARVHPDGSREEWTHDGEGNIRTQTAPGGRVTARTYGPFDVPLTETTPDGATTTFTYDTEMRLVRVNNPQGLSWDYDYDPAGQPLSETDFNGRVQTYGYDAGGQLVARVNGVGERLELGYDRLGRLAEQRSHDGTLTVFGHDALGRLVRATNADADVVLQRDVLGRVTSEVVNGRPVTSVHDAMGRRTRRTTPAGSVAQWSHDLAGRVDRLVVDGRELAFTRDLAGRETRRHLGGAAVLDQAWSPLGQLTQQNLVAVGITPAAVSGGTLADRLGGGSGASRPVSVPRALRRRSYSYADGDLVGIQDEHHGSQDFELDLLGRITAVTSSIPGSGAESYSYDGGGNLVSASWTVGASRQGEDRDEHGEHGERREYRGTLLTRSGSTRFSYDAQGRMTNRTRTRLSRKPEVWQFTWDAQDRMAGVRTPDGTHWRYRYDPLGRRVAKQRLDDDGVVAEQIDFTWDGSTLVEQQAEGSSTTWTHDGTRPLTQTSTSPGTDLTAEEVDREFYAIVTDLVGAPTELVDETGELTWQARRNIWGAPAEDADESGTPLRFPGQYADPETGLFYNLYRYYDPETARYASQDPLGLAPAPNPNAYVNNPTRHSDPLGLFNCDEAEKLAEQHITDSGDTVLGSYRPHTPGAPNYIEKAQDRGASYFDVGDNWAQLEKDGLAVKANMHFLDQVTERGDRILFSVPKNEIRTEALTAEVKYLLNERGYHWVNQWSMRPGG